MTSEKIQAGIEHVRQCMYHDQPDLMGAMAELLDLLDVIHCDHKFVLKRMGGDPADAYSNEAVRVCDRCGLEEDDDHG